MNNSTRTGNITDLFSLSLRTPLRHWTGKATPCSYKYFIADSILNCGWKERKKDCSLNFTFPPLVIAFFLFFFYSASASLICTHSCTNAAFGNGVTQTLSHTHQISTYTHAHKTFPDFDNGTERGRREYKPLYLTRS